MLDEPLPHPGVTFGGIRVVTHHEPLRARPLVVAATGCDPHLLDPQVVGHVVVAAGAGQRGGGLGVGVAQLLGVEVVPAAAGEIGAVGGGGEPGISDPHQPAQLPCPQVILDRADDPLVALAAGKGPAAHRDAVAGDRHRDHHLRQVVAHRLADRVRAHVFLRMLSYYLSWHMKHALAPILFHDNDKPATAAKRPQPRRLSPTLR